MNTFYGKLAFDSEVKSIPKRDGEGNFDVSDNTLYTSQNYKDPDVPIPVKFYNASARYLKEVEAKKGIHVVVTGYFKEEKWEQEGIKRSKLVLICTRLQVPKNNNVNTSNSESNSYNFLDHNFEDAPE